MFPVRQDWVLDLEKDKEEFGIVIEDSELKGKYKSRDSFKTFVKSKAKEAAFKYLSSLKEKHSKMNGIEFKEIKCADYLATKEINEKQAKILFMFKTRMYETKQNFRNKYQPNMNCSLCNVELCSDQHLFNCKVLKKLVPELDSNKTVKYEHIFGSVKEMAAVSELLIKVTEERDEMLTWLKK